MNMHRYLDVTDRVQPRDRSPSASVKRYFHQPQNQPHQHQQHHHESDGKKRQQDQMLQQQQPLLQGQQQLQQTQGQPQGQLLQQLPADEMINMPESVDLLRILQPAKPEIALSSSTNDGGMSVDGACTSRKPNFRPPDRDRICCMAAVLATSHPDRQSSAVAVKPDTIGDVHFENCKACREDCRMVNPVVAAAAATGAPSVLYQCSGSYCTGCQHLEQEDGEDSLYFNYLRYAATAGNGPSSSQNRYIKLGTAQSCTKHPNNISGGSYVKASPNDMSTNSRGGSGSYASTASGRNRRGSELKLAGSGSRNRRRPKWRIGNIWKNLSGSTSAIKAGDVGQSDGLAPSGGDAFLLGAAAAAAPPGKDTLTEKKRCVVKDKGVGRSGRRRRLLFVVACLVAVFIVVAGFLSALIIVTTPTKKSKHYLVIFVSLTRKFMWFLIILYATFSAFLYIVNDDMADSLRATSNNYIRLYAPFIYGKYHWYLFWKIRFLLDIVRKPWMDIRYLSIIQPP